MSLFGRIRRAMTGGEVTRDKAEDISERDLNIYIEAASERLNTFHGEVQRIEAQGVQLRHKIRDADDFIAHYHELAKAALKNEDEEEAARQLELERNERDRKQSLERQLADCERTVRTFNTQYDHLKARVTSAKEARNTLLSRMQRSEAQIDAFSVLGGVDVRDPLKDFEQLEQEAIRREARAEAEFEIYQGPEDSLSATIASLKREMDEGTDTDIADGDAASLEAKEAKENQKD